MEAYVDFSMLLKTYRKGMGWTQEETAKRWGFSFETISAWERGKRNPSNHDIPRLAKYLEITSDELAESIQHGRYRAGQRIHKPEKAEESRQAWKSTYDTWGELQQIYRTRTEFNRSFSYGRMFENAKTIRASGISLNAIAMSYSRDHIIDAISKQGTSFQLCFLDPNGRYCADREIEEEYPAGTLGHLTGINIHLMQTISNQLAHSQEIQPGALELRIYDIAPRFNIYVVDDTLMTVQSYGYGRGEDTPTFVLKRQMQGGLFDFYTSAMNHVFKHSKNLPDTTADQTERLNTK